MRQEIISFLKDVCARYNLSAYYAPNTDVWSIHKRGYAIHNFRTSQFHDIPKRYRMRNLLPIIQVGLTHNLGEKSLKGTLVLRTQLGQRIV